MVAHASRTRVWTAQRAQEHKASPCAGQLPTGARGRACPCRPLFGGHGHHDADHRAPVHRPSPEPTLGRWARPTSAWRPTVRVIEAVVILRFSKTVPTWRHCRFSPLGQNAPCLSGKASHRFFPDCFTY